MSSTLLHLAEPRLSFRQGQTAEDPRDGLALFGPLDAAKPAGIRIGVIGSPEGLALYRQWTQRVALPVLATGAPASHPAFPGFEAVFGATWPAHPLVEICLPSEEIQKRASIRDRHQRVFASVNLFSEAITKALWDREEVPDVWYVVIPDIVYLNCRPQSTVRRDLQTENPFEMSPRLAKLLRTQMSMFEQDTVASLPYSYEVDFHHQLKARLLPTRTPTQIVKESTLLRALSGEPSDADAATAIAWNLSTSTLYKAGGRPWKAGTAREGVCYLGLVFKADAASGDGRSACCAAQMFIDSGDGFVFRSARGAFRAERRGSFHLTADAAQELLATALTAYREARGSLPKEVFIHGRVKFNDEEWMGFLSAAANDVEVTGVTIRDSAEVKLYGPGDYPVLRGTALPLGKRSCALWTRGLVPRLGTYPGLETPNPLIVTITHGRAPILTVLADVMALTKLNYNACIHSDGVPVTLKFADAVGEILTAAPLEGTPPLPFKHYI